jgi:hypothetical protein
MQLCSDDYPGLILKKDHEGAEVLDLYCLHFLSFIMNL